VFAKRIKSIRKGLGKSQAEFAKGLGYSRSQVIEWELGRNTPSGQSLVAIATKLSVTTGYLLGITDNPTAEASEEDLTPVERLLIALERLREATDAVQQALDFVRSGAGDN
jgi:transcriptional regulator with XRE-family HTH domain